MMQPRPALKQVSALPAGQALFGLFPEELEAHFRGSTSGAAVFGRLHRPKNYVAGTPSVSRRSVGGKHTAPATPRLLDVEHAHRAGDGSTKFVLRLFDGHVIETVLMPRAVKNARATICVSSQVGCAMGCTFCATGKLGLLRHLDAAEIVLQVLTVLAHDGAETGTTLGGHQVTLVYMGMGEPLHNLAAVHRSIRLLTHRAGLDIAPRRITVSTSGLVPQINALAALTPRPLLAVSVNATTNEARTATMPVTKRYDLDALMGALEAWPFAPRERILLEYVLLAGENDADADADRLAQMAKRFPALINVIPYNAIADAAFARPSDADARAFVAKLFARGVRATVRFSRGDDVAAACGQLAGPVTQPRRHAGTA